MSLFKRLISGFLSFISGFDYFIGELMGFISGFLHFIGELHFRTRKRQFLRICNALELLFKRAMTHSFFRQVLYVSEAKKPIVLWLLPKLIKRLCNIDFCQTTRSVVLMRIFCWFWKFGRRTCTKYSTRIFLGDCKKFVFPKGSRA